jgi:hypothetical protein
MLMLFSRTWCACLRDPLPLHILLAAIQQNRDEQPIMIMLESSKPLKSAWKTRPRHGDVSAFFQAVMWPFCVELTMQKSRGKHSSSHINNCSAKLQL